MTDELTASVIIPAYSMDRLNDIMKAIHSVAYQNRKPKEIIIAVDHNRELVDTLSKIVPSCIPDVSVVINDGIIGGAETRNVGIRAASGDIVAFLDDDAWAERNWLDRLLAAYDNPEVMAAGGRTISYFDFGRPKWFPEELDWMVGGTWKGHPEESCEVRNLIGPNMSFRRHVCDTIGYMLSELGAMPKKARAGDETEFYIRLKRMMPHAKVVYVPDAVAYHRVYSWKMSAKNMAFRALSDGYWKERTRHTSDSFKADGHSSERDYLRFLLLKSVPGKAIRRPEQAMVIISCVVCVGAGYIWSKIKGIR